MYFGISFDVCCFVFLTILSIVYFNKNRIVTEENTIYNKLLILSVIGLIVEIGCYWTAISNISPTSIIIWLISRLFLLYMLYWSILFTDYISTISRKKHYFDKKKTILNMILIVLSLIIIISPMEYYNDGVLTYSYGMGTYLLGGLDALLIITDIVWIFKNYNNIEKKKIYPLLLLIVLLVVLIIVKMINPGINLIASIFSLVIFLMYFTIENPDVKMIEQLNLAKDQADKANQAKTDFLSSMSHEIRTPLNAIVGFSDCIINADNIEEAKENAKDVVNASQTLLEIVNGILDISKIEAGKLEIVNSPYNAKTVFEELAKLITPKMKDKALDFTYNIAPDLPETLYGDHANIKKIITNLLSNACKYTDKGFVHYEVSCFNVNGICKLIISVEDSGRGIKQENVNKLFTKFQRLDEDRNTTIEGTGLGLAITKQLVELMGGKIIVHTVYGEGSKFTVTIDQRIEEVKISETEKVVNSNLDLTGKRILIVDDNILNIKVATKLLQRYQATNITSFENGFDCINDVESGSKYDVILLDDMMPKMSGVETLKKLKEIPNFNIPVVALTANAITGMKEKYLNEGFDNYLAKPIEKDELINVLNEILNTKQVEDKTEELEIFEYEELVPEPTFDKEYLLQNNVDLDKALELLGDMDMYNNTMVDFISELPEKWNRLVEYKDQSDMENYAIEIHSLKSDCKYLGFTTLADIAYQHELKSKENDLSYVQNNFDKLETEYKKVKRISTHYIENQNDII